jgi:hypothetical protein
VWVVEMKRGKTMPTDTQRAAHGDFELATPNDGDQRVRVFSGDKGWYWHNTPRHFWPKDRHIEWGGPYDAEQVALDMARAHYGYGPYAK